MLERLVLYGLPALSGLALAFVVAGPGRADTVVAARVYGLMCKDAEAVALRVELAEQFHGLVAPRDGEVAVELRTGPGGDARVLGSFAGATVTGGAVEAALTLSEPLPAGAFVEVRHEGRTVAAREIGVHLPLATAKAPEHEGSPGDVAIRVRLPRGVAVPEHPERLEALIESPLDAHGEPPRLEVKSVGADVSEPERAEAPTCRNGRCSSLWTLDVTARAPTAELTFEAAAAGKTRTVTVAMPLAQGGLWLRPDARETGRIELFAASPKPFAYVSLLSRRGRIFGAIVPLAVTEDGRASGSIALPPPVPEPLTLVVASEPTERSGAVAWPLEPLGERVVPGPLELLIDGMPDAIVAEDARQRRARLPVVVAIVATAAAVLLTLHRRQRRARVELEQRLMHAGAAPNLVAASRLGAFAAAVMTVLAVAFAVLAMVAAFA